MGRTPGAYGFVVSCNLQGFVPATATVMAAKLVLTKNKCTSLTPLSAKWSYPGGKGPATLQLDMVCADAAGAAGGKGCVPAPQRVARTGNHPPLRVRVVGLR